MSVLDNFQEWKEFLSARVNQAHSLGMDNQNIQDLAYQLGDYLSNVVDPQNDQERVLKDLWDAASEEEQRMLAGLMVKMVSDGKK